MASSSSRPKWALILISLLVLVTGGFMLYDGLHALLTGDYVTPKGGEHAGQLGPWKHAVRALGLAPRSTTVKLGFVLYGALYLGALYLYLRSARWGFALLIVAACGTWYLPWGTITNVLVIALLFHVWRKQRR